MTYRGAADILAEAVRLNTGARSRRGKTRLTGSIDR